VRFLQYFVQHLLLLSQYADHVFLFFEIVLEVVVLPLLLFILFGLLACFGEFHDFALVLLYDLVLLLQLVLVVSLDVYLVSLQLQHFARSFIQLLLHARTVALRFV